ncbi:leucyl/phenylalanyl-tRNA--protein transferase [Eoetvoesiella caeni]
MKTLAWLDEHTPFPHPDHALGDGLLAAGGTLTIARLADAYSKGIFPWYNEGDPILWWSPEPRMLLRCADFNASRSLRKKLRQLARQEQDADARVQIRMNMAFAQVMQACGEPRDGQSGTWISPDILAAYGQWHQEGRVHSIETWIDGELAGGLYGVSLGRFFFGESMFSRAADASKLALAYLVIYLMQHGVKYIDCQQQTKHLGSLGAKPVARKLFLEKLEQSLHYPPPPWGHGQLLQSGKLAPPGTKTP